jgi:signal transduction histidine kinase
MLTSLAIILSIILQVIAVAIVVSLIRGSKYKSSWILLSIGLSMMALRRLYELFIFYQIPIGETTLQLNNWLGVLISILIVIGVFYVKKIFGYMARMQELREESEKKVLSAIINTEEKERKRVANELHDGLGPLLSTIKMSLYALAPEKTQASSKKPIYVNAIESVDEAIKSLREISNNLSPSVLEDFGLIAAIKSFIGKTETAAEVKIEFVTNMTEKVQVNKETSLIIYRSLCELIHNTIKHAKAGKIMISLYQENQEIKLLYQDNGVGFNYDSPMSRQPLGMGLNTIQSRIASIEGEFELKSRPGEGVFVTVEVKADRHE